MSNTIADNLARLQAARTAIAGAITAKGGTVAVGDGLEDFPTAITSIPSGGGGVSENDVTFYDYDGTVVNAYSKIDFLALSAMPANPTHKGLTAQGWNWSLADAKAYVTKYGQLNIGQMYVTDDGRTRLYVQLQEGRLSPILKLYLNANSELDIDWGDGSTHSTFISTEADYVSEQHNYASAGDYVVSIGVTSGSFVLQSSTTISTLFTAGKASASSADLGYLNSIEKIEIGSGVTSLGTYAFANCYSLSQIIIPESVTSIDGFAFYNCCLLSQIIIPEGVTSLNNYVFYNCCSLSQIIIPEAATSISEGAFYGCYSLSQVTIPEGVTSIKGYTFYACRSLGYIKFTRQTPPTVTASNAWTSVPTDCKILVPKGTLTAYKSATNYPNPSAYTYEEYDV